MGSTSEAASGGSRRCGTPAGSRPPLLGREHSRHHDRECTRACARDAAAQPYKKKPTTVPAPRPTHLCAAIELVELQSTQESSSRQGSRLFAIERRRRRGGGGTVRRSQQPCHVNRLGSTGASRAGSTGASSARITRRQLSGATHLVHASQCIDRHVEAVQELELV